MKKITLKGTIIRIPSYLTIENKAITTNANVINIEYILNTMFDTTYDIHNKCTHCNHVGTISRKDKIYPKPILIFWTNSNNPKFYFPDTITLQLSQHDQMKYKLVGINCFENNHWYGKIHLPWQNKSYNINSIDSKIVASKNSTLEGYHQKGKYFYYIKIS